MSRLEVILIVAIIVIIAGFSGRFFWKRHAERQRVESIRILTKLKDASIRTNKVIDACNKIMNELREAPERLRELNKNMMTGKMDQQIYEIKKIGNDHDYFMKESKRVCVADVMANKPVAEQALKLVQEGKLEDAEHLIDSMVVHMPEGF